MLRVASDVGGTFTDLVYFEVDKQSGQAGIIQTAKSDTTPNSYEIAVFDTINKSKVDISESIFFAHGTTVIINSITERKGVTTGLITTKGFRDTLEIARGDRPDFFNLRYKKPQPFVPRYLRAEVPGRIDFLGKEIQPLDLSNLNSILNNFKKYKVQAIAVCLIHSYANSLHEQKVVDHIKNSWPDVDVVSSYQINREWREYERSNTTVLCAYVKPIARNYLDKLSKKLKESNKSNTELIYGDKEVLQFITSREVDLALNAIVGIAGLKPTLGILKSGTKLLALANKESLVMAGEIVMNESEAQNIKILPVDSEHSAIWQCLAGEKHSEIKKIILTASGGPFRELTKDRFKNITVKDALNHPNWDMGNKITIDSATMMNKGFEVIETKWLFNISAQDIDILVHPQSIIHSLVEFKDTSIKAQLGIPDMKIPINYALNYPSHSNL